MTPRGLKKKNDVKATIKSEKTIREAGPLRTQQGAEGVPETDGQKRDLQNFDSSDLIVDGTITWSLLPSFREGNDGP